MLTERICLTILALLGLTVATDGGQSLCCPREPFWKQRKHISTDEGDDLSQLGSVIPDVKKPKENQLLHGTEDVLRIRNQWDAFVATTVKRLNDTIQEMTKLKENVTNLERSNLSEEAKPMIGMTELKGKSYNVTEELIDKIESVNQTLIKTINDVEQMRCNFTNQEEWLVGKMKDDKLRLQNRTDIETNNVKQLEQRFNTSLENTLDGIKYATKKQAELADERHDEVLKLTHELRETLEFYVLGFKLLLVGCGVMAVVMTLLVVNVLGGMSPELRPTASTGRQFRRSENNDDCTLKWKGQAENSICVVTFNSPTERNHVDETRSVFESVGSTPLTIHSRVIRLHTDIQDLRGSRVFFVFVDFNERNVILEDPAIGLGDLRLTTVRTLWKFGGDVSVIYCGDKGSRNMDGALFNPYLTSINSHSELTQLKEQNRIFSIDDHFTDYQKEHCRAFINKILKRT